MLREEIKIGYTNRKFKRGNKFFLIKNQNEFNHRIDYKILNTFDFIPKLIKEDGNELVWEFIEGKHLDNPTNNDLKQLAKILRTLHKSDLVFPKNNMRKRLKQYLRKLHSKKQFDPIIENNYREMINLLSKMSRLNPLHNDLRSENILKDKTGKIWIVDWEYATMGDKHFDISYYMESMALNQKQRAIFLNEYNAYDNYQAYIPEWLSKYERFVNYLTICWALAQKQLPFALEDLKKRL